MHKLCRTIADPDRNPYYANQSELETALIAENARIGEAVQVIREGIRFYTDRTAKSLIRLSSSSLKEKEKEKDWTPAGQAFESGERLQKDNNHAEAIKMFTSAIN